MTLRLDTAVAKDISAAFTPAGDFEVQALCAQGTGVFIDIWARIQTDEGCDYQLVSSYEAAEQPITKWSQLADVKVGYSGNTVGQNVKIWVV